MLLLYYIDPNGPAACVVHMGARAQGQRRSRAIRTR